MCQPSARSADKMTFVFYLILHQLEEKIGVFSTFLSRLAPQMFRLMVEKNQDFCGENVFSAE